MHLLSQVPFHIFVEVKFSYFPHLQYVSALKVFFSGAWIKKRAFGTTPGTELIYLNFIYNFILKSIPGKTEALSAPTQWWKYSLLSISLNATPAFFSSAAACNINPQKIN
jgi:hypothetical protein